MTSDSEGIEGRTTREFDDLSASLSLRGHRDASSGRRLLPACLPGVRDWSPRPAPPPSNLREERAHSRRKAGSPTLPALFALRRGMDVSLFLLLGLGVACSRSLYLSISVSSFLPSFLLSFLRLSSGPRRPSLPPSLPPSQVKVIDAMVYPDLGREPL